MKNSRFGIMVIVGLVGLAVIIALFGPLLVRKREGTKDAGTPGAMVTSKGIVESEEETELRSLVSGPVREMRVDEGDAVKRGDTLAIIDSAKISAKIAEAEAGVGEAGARLRQMEAGFRSEDVAMARERAGRAEAVYLRTSDEYRRQERLYQKDAVTLLERDRAEERMKVASAEWNEAKSSLRKFRKGERREDVDAARAALSRGSAEVAYYRALLADHTITSPINGVVTERIKKRGEMVDVGTPILRLINPDRMRIRAEVDETDAGKVKPGMKVEVVVDSSTGKTYRGGVTRVLPYVKRKAQKTFDPMASYDINTEQVYIRLDSFEGLKSGMTVTVRFLK
jgi:multidrug resistance efflux pump